ncbi:MULTISPECIES: hypothetical protein [unclassified Acinetobacter]|uniref:hypothetical protein n=1 Tax=unclassified Acinetobacter TaxID=196816 RepID=UPI00124FF701|nr:MULTISPECIES: hypothetical protein [unclassified Acinetobacter]
MVKYIVLSVCCIASSFSLAETNFKVPEGYSFGTNIAEDGKSIYVLDSTKSTANKDLLVFMSSGANKPDEDNVWFTTCLHKLTKGLQDFQCSIENKGLYINISQDMELVIFNKSDIKQGVKPYKINYKIDKGNIITIPTQFLHSFQANSFFSSLSKGEKLSFSWEKNGAFKSQNLDLSGLGRSISFARQAVKLNR